MCLENWTSVLTSHYIPKINSDYVIWSTCKPKTIIFLEESIGEDLHNLGLGKHFLDGMLKSQTIKEKIKSWTWLILQMSVPHKTPLKWKGKPWTRRKYSQYSSEDFYIKFLKQKNSHNALMRSPTNHRQTMWTDTSSKKIGRWPINTLKGVQHSSIVIKEVQIKTTIDTTTHPLNWIKLKRLSMPNDSKDTKQLKLSLRHF